MTEECISPAHELFVRDLRRALYHLYDPDELRRNPMFRYLIPEHHGSPSALRDFLLDAIGRLRPAAGVSLESSAWYTYRLLQYRFADHFDQAKVAANLGLSIRQISRQERRALQTLADVLWRAHDLEARYGQELSPGQDSGLSTYSRTAVKTTDSGETELAGITYSTELLWLGRTLPLEPVDVTQLIRSAMVTADPLLQTLRVQATYDLPAGLPAVEVQLGPVRQVLLVLLSEAIRSAAGARLLLTASPGPQQVTISVQAMAADHAPIYARSDKKNAQLEMAQGLAALSGGSLTILPGNDGLAFAARLHLPRVALLSVLFVDDNADAHQLYQRYLAGSRYGYVGERDAEQVVARAEAIAPHIIVLDVMLPGIDGWELLGRLRAHPRTRDIPVIICSILLLDQLALSLGAAAVLQKPVTQAMLLRALDQQAEALAKGSR